MSDHGQELDRIRAEMAQLTSQFGARIAELQDRVRSIGAPRPATRVGDVATAAPSAEPAPSRRALLSRAGKVAAAGTAVAVGVPLLRGDPAAAATGDPLILGAFNTCVTSITSTQLAADSATALSVTNISSGGGDGLYAETPKNGAAVWGRLGSSAGVVDNAGVLGQSAAGRGVAGYSASNSGVYGRAGAASGQGGVAGVFGDSTNHTGVAGMCKNGTGVYGRSGIASGRLSGFAGVVGDSSARNGVAGFSKTESGVFGASDFGLGVYGVADEPTGSAIPVAAVAGDSAAAIGVAGVSTTSTGVYGRGRRGGSFTGQAAQVRLQPSAAATHPASGAAGDLFVDASKRLWFCKGSGTWIRLA